MNNYIGEMDTNSNKGYIIPDLSELTDEEFKRRLALLRQEHRNVMEMCGAESNGHTNNNYINGGVNNNGDNYYNGDTNLKYGGGDEDYGEYKNGGNGDIGDYKGVDNGDYSVDNGDCTHFKNGDKYDEYGDNNGENMDHIIYKKMTENEDNYDDFINGDYDKRNHRNINNRNVFDDENEGLVMAEDPPNYSELGLRAYNSEELLNYKLNRYFLDKNDNLGNEFWDSSRYDDFNRNNFINNNFNGIKRRNSFGDVDGERKRDGIVRMGRSYMVEKRPNTVCRPFKMTLREENKKLKKGMVKELKRLKDEMRNYENEKRNRRNFKALPLPSNTFLSLMGTKESEDQERRLVNAEIRKELHRGRAFSFMNREEAKKKFAESKRNLEEKILDDNSQNQEFKAVPFPEGIYSDKYEEDLKKKKILRHIQAFERSQKLLRSSKLPSNMQLGSPTKHHCGNLEAETPHIYHSHSHTDLNHHLDKYNYYNYKNFNHLSNNKYRRNNKNYRNLENSLQHHNRYNNFNQTIQNQKNHSIFSNDLPTFHDDQNYNHHYNNHHNQPNHNTNHHHSHNNHNTNYNSHQHHQHHHTNPHHPHYHKTKFIQKPQPNPSPHVTKSLMEGNIEYLNNPYHHRGLTNDHRLKNKILKNNVAKLFDNDDNSKFRDRHTTKNQKSLKYLQNTTITKTSLKSSSSSSSPTHRDRRVTGNDSYRKNNGWMDEEEIRRQVEADLANIHI